MWLVNISTLYYRVPVEVSSSGFGGGKGLITWGCYFMIAVVFNKSLCQKLTMLPFPPTCRRR